MPPTTTVEDVLLHRCPSLTGARGHKFLQQVQIPTGCSFRLSVTTTATTCNQLGSSRVQFASSCAKSRPQLERNLTQLERALTQLERDVCGTRFRVAFEKRCLFHSVLRVPGAHKRARCQPNLGPCYPLPRAQRSRLPVASLLFALPLAPSPFFPLFPFPPCFPLPFLPPFFPLPPLSPLPLALPL